MTQRSARNFTALFRPPSSMLQRQLHRVMHLRYLLVLDFEATCDHTGTLVPREEMEIIEFPTLLYDMEDD